MRRIIVLSFVWSIIQINPLFGQDIDSWAKAISNQLDVLNSTDDALLELLPMTFEDYLSLWGNLDSPLYERTSVIEHLFHSELIDYPEFIKRVIGISVGAVPGVDHVYSLQYVVRHLLQTNLRQVVEYLNQRSASENIQFWSFVFGGIEERVTVEYCEGIKKKLLNLKKYKNNGYRFIDTIDLGYQKSYQYAEQH